MSDKEAQQDQTKEYLWTHEPDWECPHCRTSNFGHRERCRSCGYDSNAGEFPYYNPLPPYQGGTR